MSAFKVRQVFFFFCHFFAKNKRLESAKPSPLEPPAASHFNSNIYPLAKVEKNKKIWIG